MYKSMLTVVFVILGALFLVHFLAGCETLPESYPREHRHDNDTQVVIVGDQADAEMEMGCIS